MTEGSAHRWVWGAAAGIVVGWLALLVAVRPDDGGRLWNLAPLPGILLAAGLLAWAGRDRLRPVEQRWRPPPPEPTPRPQPEPPGPQPRELSAPMPRPALSQPAQSQPALSQPVPAPIQPVPFQAAASQPVAFQPAPVQPQQPSVRTGELPGQAPGLPVTRVPQPPDRGGPPPPPGRSPVQLGATADAAFPNWQLHWQLPDGRSGVVVLPDGPAVALGRQPDCHLIVDMDEVSRVHLRLNVMRGRVEVEDTGSRNGTWMRRGAGTWSRLPPRQAIALTAWDQFRISEPWAVAFTLEPVGR